MARIMISSTVRSSTSSMSWKSWRLCPTQMEEPEQGNNAQNRRDLEAYQSRRKKDCYARFTMLSSMHNDLIGEFESYGTTQDMWIALKAKFGGTMVTRLRALTLKFDTFRMQRGDSM